MAVWKRSGLFGGYWGWFYGRNNRLMIALNEGGEEFAFNLQLWRGLLPVGFYAAVRLWGDHWFRRTAGLRVIR